MKPVAQTKFRWEGNCFPACVASLLECAIEDVPDYRDGEHKWWLDYCTWIRTLGHKLETYDLDVAPAGQYLIADVPSPTLPGERHSVIWKDGVIVWDPLPPHRGVYTDIGRCLIAIGPLTPPGA